MGHDCWLIGQRIEHEDSREAEMEEGADHESRSNGTPGAQHPLRGLLFAQLFGQFNDQAWKAFVILLAIAATAGEAERQKQTAIAQVILMIPLLVISLPAGVLADRVSKRSVIVALKVVEVVLMLAGTAVLFVQPQGGLLALLVLALLGVQ